MKVPSDIVQVLDNCTINGTGLTMPQLDPAIYKKVNKVLEAAGGKWNRKAQAHVFPSDPSDIIDQIAPSGKVMGPLDYDCYFTPHPLAVQAARAAGIDGTSVVLEPSAGHGALLRAAVDLGVEVHCVELLPANVAHLNALGLAASVTQSDFLSIPPEAKFSVVLMNPPFTKMNDSRHVLHAFDFVKPGGILVSVMGASVLYRECALPRQVRALAGARGGSIIDLPANSFRLTGTSVATVLVTLRKP